MGKRVLIINRCKSSNLGDQMIGLAATSLFEKYGYDVDNVDFVTINDLRKINLKGLKENKNRRILRSGMKLYSKSRTLRRVSWFFKNKTIFEILKIKKYDMVLIGGGELIQSNVTFPIALNLWVKNIKKYQKEVPIVLFSIGVSNNIQNYDKYLIASSLKYINQIYVRDYNSLNNLKNIFKKDAKLVPDIVFSMDIPNARKEDNKILYGITLFDRISRHNNIFKSKKEYYNHVFNELEKLKKEGNVSLIYSNPEDFNACLDFLEYTNNKYGVNYDLPKYETLTEFIGLIQSSKVVISPRMHALIPGVLCKKQVYPVCISDKINTFNNLYLKDKTYDEIFKQTDQLSQEINKVVVDLIRELKYETQNVH